MPEGREQVHKGLGRQVAQMSEVGFTAKKDRDNLPLLSSSQLLPWGIKTKTNNNKINILLI